MNDAPEGPKAGKDGEDGPETLADVLASIRSLVSAETLARVEGRTPSDVILLTSEMRVAEADLRAGDILSDGLEDDDDDVAPPQLGASGAPILDEAALRGMINSIVREELQSELGERIGRNLRKLVRREIALLLDEARKSDKPAD